MRLSSGKAGIACGQSCLELDRALHRVDCAGEFDKQAVASMTDDAPHATRDLGLDHFGAKPLQLRKRASLVRLP